MKTQKEQLTDAKNGVSPNALKKFRGQLWL